MGLTATIYSKEESLRMLPKDRPINFRVPSAIYHDVWKAVGGASMCWKTKPPNEEFNPSAAEKVALELLFSIAAQLEIAGLIYEKWPEAWKG